MATELNLSLGGYGKIERDETDITLSRLQNIARILETELDTLLNFDSNNVFNQKNNNIANGVVHNQQLINDQGLSEEVKSLKTEMELLKQAIYKIQKNG
jgi:transcriptional regulator with XRE-family HTH domain